MFIDFEWREWENGGRAIDVHGKKSNVNIKSLSPLLLEIY